MWNIVLKLILQIAGSEVAKTAVAIGVNKLLEAKEDGITKDIAKVMIDGVAKSKLNPTTRDMFKESMEVLNG